MTAKARARGGAPLTAEQERFCQEIAQGAKGSPAYRCAFPKARRWAAQDVAVEACRLRASPKIATRVSELVEVNRKIATERYAVSEQRIIDELARIAFSNVTDYMRRTPDGGLVADFADMTRDEAAAIQSVEVTQLAVPDEDGGEDDGGGSGGAAAVACADGEAGAAPEGMVKIKFKLGDKRQALRDLGQHLGMFKERVEVTGLEALAERLRGAIQRKRSRRGTPAQA